ncbi:hypothetical protein EIP86_008374 [Pleurotus ostreatoroseus]|nr:hypothetical protein EIP86_008374 [Pleurotus ostreatoroseus]
MFGASLVALNYWIRFRYLNKYTQLKEPPLVKADAQELHPDVNTPEAAPAFHNYLDEFLQAVRVFGFLEKPVFHELARHLQTRRLIAGDSISLDQDKSFYCVVDGTVQLFAHTGHGGDTRQRGAWDEENMNGYQLLNEVGTGGTLSSLFTILSLFTENIKISWQDEELLHDDDTESVISASGTATTETHRPLRVRPRRSDSDVSQMSLDNAVLVRPSQSRSPRVTSPRARGRGASVSSSGSTIHADDYMSPPLRSVSRGPSMSAVSSGSGRTAYGRRRPPPEQHTHHYGVVARATEDSTLAVIPAEAFRRLTKKFPKATAHIVQVILTRFSRVTFNAAHNYLGLTTEVLRTEKAINDIACHPLPPSFYEGGGLRQLRQRFDGVSTSDSDNDSDYFSLPGSSRPSTNTSAESSTGALNDVPGRSAATSHLNRRTSTSGTLKGASSRAYVQAGDLLSSASTVHTDSSRKPHSITATPVTPHPRPRFLREHSQHVAGADDFDLRDEVMSCIAKSIGLLQPPLSGEESVEASPAFAPSEGGRSRGGDVFRSSFGSLSLLDMGDDESSMTGGSSTSASTSDGYLSGLDNKVEIKFYPAGSVLAKAGEINTGLFYVIEGFLDIHLPAPTHGNVAQAPVGKPSQQNDGRASRAGPEGSFFSEKYTSSRPDPRTSDPKPLFTVKPGGIAGYLSSLCNTASYVDIKAKTDTYVGFLPADALEGLIEKRPIVLLTLAKRLISLLSPLILHIDGSLDWVQVNAGQVLWRPEDVSDSFYIVINGRLRAITDKEGGGVSIVAEYGQGDTVGELDVITSSPRRNTVHAIRDTELIRMPQTLFNAISSRNPGTTAQLLRMIASRVRSEVDSSARNVPLEPSRTNINLKTVAVLPSTRNVPIDAFGRKLEQALNSIGAPTSYLNQVSVSNHLGRHAFTRMGKLKAAGWLAEQEQKFRIADYVMVVGMGEDPTLGEYERLLLSMKTTARKELVLLHPDRSVVPGSTREWLKFKGLITSVSRPVPTPQDPAAVAALKNLKDKVQSGIQKYRRTPADPRPQRGPHTNDFARLARRICGRSIGVVLGGGGARTSIGAFVGGLYAREGDLISSAGRTKQFSGRMGNIWRILSDVTYPIVAYTTGHEFNRSIYKAFYDLHIEDMWLPYFCNSTNITTSTMEIHETGYAWRFIRASMTLVGLLPPLCDGGNMLVDGGYIDNLPVAAMMSMGANAVIASDVGSIDDNSPRNFGDSVSGFWLLLNRWNPFSSAKSVPAITEIQSRLAYVSSVRTLEEAKVVPACLYMQMPVQEFGTLQFNKFEDIQKKGYQAAMEMLAKWQEEGHLPSAFVSDKNNESAGTTKGRSARRNSI